MLYDFWEFRVIMVCSSTERVTVLFCVCCRLDEEELILKEECCSGGDDAPALGPASVSECAAAERKRCSDSLKLGPDSMALSSPDLSEKEYPDVVDCCIILLALLRALVAFAPPPPNGEV